MMIFIIQTTVKFQLSGDQLSTNFNLNTNPKACKLFKKKKKPCAIKIDTTKYVHKISVLLFLNFHNKNF